MTSTTHLNSSGPGFLTLLAVALVVLRLCEVITWPWIVVLLPLWLPFAFGVGCLILVGVAYGIYRAVGE